MSSPSNNDKGTADKSAVDDDAYAHFLNLPVVRNNQIRGERSNDSNTFEELLLLEQKRQRRQSDQSPFHEQQQVMRNNIVVPPNSLLLVPGDAGMSPMFQNPQQQLLLQTTSDLQRSQQLQAPAMTMQHNMIPVSIGQTTSFPYYYYDAAHSNNPVMIMTSGALPTMSSSLMMTPSQPTTTSSNHQQQSSIYNRPTKSSVAVAEDSTTSKSETDTMMKRKKKKPKRPLSAYNFFFKHERERILKSIDEQNEKKISSKTSKERFKDDDENEVDQKASSSKNSVKKKKEAHGKISFENLAKTIGVRWAKLDEKDMEYYQEFADEDLKRYKKETSECVKKEEEADAEKQNNEKPIDSQQNSTHHQIPFLNMMDNKESYVGFQEMMRQQQSRTLQQQIECSNINTSLTTNPQMQPQLVMQRFQQQNLLNLQSTQGLNINQQTRQPYQQPQQQQQQFMGSQYDPTNSFNQQEFLLMQQLNQRQSWVHNPNQLDNQFNHHVKMRKLNDGRQKDVDNQK